MVKIRPIQANEYSILENFLYYAVFVPPGQDTLSRDVIYVPEIYMYIEDFGRANDTCIIAEEDGFIIGAAWSRILVHPRKEGYGNIDDKTPELAVSVLPEYRSRGTGTRLIDSLICTLKGKGYTSLSLSVQKENPALRLYLRLGFQIINENAEDYIMALNLN